MIALSGMDERRLATTEFPETFAPNRSLLFLRDRLHEPNIFFANFPTLSVLDTGREVLSTARIASGSFDRLRSLPPHFMPAPLFHLRLSLGHVPPPRSDRLPCGPLAKQVARLRPHCRGDVARACFNRGLGAILTKAALPENLRRGRCPARSSGCRFRQSSRKIFSSKKACKHLNTGYPSVLDFGFVSEKESGLISESAPAQVSAEPKN